MWKINRRQSKVYDGQLSRSVHTPQLVYGVAVTVAKYAAEYVGGEFDEQARDLYLACERVAAHAATSQESGRVLRAYNEIRRAE